MRKLLPVQKRMNSDVFAIIQDRKGLESYGFYYYVGK